MPKARLSRARHAHGQVCAQARPRSPRSPLRSPIPRGLAPVVLLGFLHHPCSDSAQSRSRSRPTQAVTNVGAPTPRSSKAIAQKHVGPGPVVTGRGVGARGIEERRDVAGEDDKPAQRQQDPAEQTGASARHMRQSLELDRAPGANANYAGEDEQRQVEEEEALVVAGQAQIGRAQHVLHHHVNDERSGPEREQRRGRMQPRHNGRGAHPGFGLLPRCRYRVLCGRLPYS
jgi:hypothetical protein